MHQHAERSDESNWIPQDPSLAQIRQSIVEYCILPNGSASIKASLPPEKLIKTIMLYGPSGAGKTLMVEAVANELGALLIHLTPAKLRGEFGGKTGPTKLVHMVMTVARDPTMQPCVIYIDECEQFFTGGKKNKDKDGPSRFKKDFTLYKNQALGPEHRVIVIGTTKLPENGDMKDFKAFFDKFLFFPYPDYASRVLLWRHYISERVEYSLNKEIDRQRRDGEQVQSKLVNLAMIASMKKSALDKLNLSALAHVSEGYSAGYIVRTVRTIVTDRRVQTLQTRPLRNVDFLDNLAIQEVTYLDDKKALLSFTKQITGIDDRRGKIEDILSGAAAGGDDKKKGGGKKK
jgi:IQ and AAA domain-containing protein